VDAFTRLLKEQGHSIRLYDVVGGRARDLAGHHAVEWSESLSGAVSGAELTLICAPTDVVPGIIDEVAIYAGGGSIVSEISSLKIRTVLALRRAARLRPLSIHPMFGPDIKSFSDETIAVVAVRDQERETETAKALFPGGKLVPVEPDIHDRCMASILSLPYFVNVAFAGVLSQEDLSLMRELAGPTFEVQLAVTECVVGESPELIRSLIADNQFSWELVDRFLEESKRVQRLFEFGPREVDRFLTGLKTSLERDKGFVEARDLRYAVKESLKNTC
jgi:prephenate dehydrogenase